MGDSGVTVRVATAAPSHGRCSLPAWAGCFRVTIQSSWLTSKSADSCSLYAHLSSENPYRTGGLW
jgi:hypothetical protein